MENRIIKRTLPLLSFSFLLGLPLTLPAKGITSPGDLGPADYWAWIEATNGAFPRAESRNTTPVSINLANPIINGVAVVGNLEASNDLTSTGPGTSVYANLSYSGAPAFDTDIDLRSLVTFDLAAFGAPGSAANVRVTGYGIGGRVGYVFGPSGQVYATSSGYLTIYSTDASGAIDSFVKTFEVPGNLSSTPIDDIITLNRNELYKVIVRSYIDARVFNMDSFDLSAYMILDPMFTSETAGVDVFVSPGAAPVPLPGAALLFGAGLGAALVRSRRCRTGFDQVAKEKGAGR